MTEKSPDTALALSGGVDSMTAALLLKRQGLRVLGVHFLTGFEANDSLTPIKEAARKLDIPLRIVDVKNAFDLNVVTPFCQAYLKGLTPNPCMACNPVIKFGTVLEEALKPDIPFFATGHYARIRKKPDGSVGLFKGKDLAKDQSYFLARINPARLDKILFPLGDWLKTDVKSLALESGLMPHIKTESQDSCFIKDQKVAQFIMDRENIPPRPGPIVDRLGHEIGVHKGVFHYTIGQRRGLNCPAEKPYYVLALNPKENRVVVGSEEDLYKTACHVARINWIAPPGNKKPFRAKTRIRYRAKEAWSTVTPTGEDSALVVFDTPQSAVTPGQGAVFYREDEVLGGGWIQGDEDA